MNNQENKLSHIIKLPNLDFKTQMNIPIDQNAHIKSVINVQPYIFNTNYECSTGKCDVRGKIGVKIVYLDVDNVCNTISHELDFNESVHDDKISSDTKILLYGDVVGTSATFDDKYLKISLSINAKLLGNIDFSLQPCDTTSPDLMLKKNEVSASQCVDTIKSRANINDTIRLPHRANKILNICILPTVEKTECNNNYLTIYGRSRVQVIYDVDNEEMCELKFYEEEQNWSYEVQANCQDNSLTPLSISIDNSNISFTTELNDTQTDINLEYDILTQLVVYNTIQLEYVEDLYSTTNDLEAHFSDLEFDHVQNMVCYKTCVDGEIQLNDNNAIDEILFTTNYSCLVTQSYFENNNIVLEGVLSTNLTYLNEQKEVNSINVDLPFSISKTYETKNNCELLNFEITPTSCKCKIKRGNTLSLDYEIHVLGYTNEKQHATMLDNITLGKTYDYGEIAFQITVAKPNETIWEFCKRTHTSQSDLHPCNKEIPPVFQGGEKIIIYR